LSLKGYDVGVNTVAPFALFAAFMAIFWWQSRRAGMPMDEWLRRRNRETFSRRGWWIPMTVGSGILVAGFIVASTVSHGWKGQYLIAIPLVFGFLAVGLPLLGWIGRRR
jgi:hypothetical protein